MLSVTQPAGEEPDLLVRLDREALWGAGRVAIGAFLAKLQVHKSSGDVAAASALFSRYAQPTEPWTSWRAIVLANKRPRKMFVQSNTVLSAEKGEVVLRSYEASAEGLITSWIDGRFEDCAELYEAVAALADRDKHHFV